MPVYWVVRYMIREGQEQNWFAWLASQEAKDLWKALEQTSGMKHLQEYRVVAKSGPTEYESWSELPDFEALQRVDKSPVLAALMKRGATMTEVATSSAHIYEPVP
jgi:hypothetical protein